MMKCGSRNATCNAAISRLARNVHNPSILISEPRLIMPDLRKDPIVGRWVIIAKSRAKRPHDFDTTPRRHSGAFCPFCEDNEDKTPRRDHRLPPARARSRNREGWRVRVVPNKFPALEIEGRTEQARRRHLRHDARRRRPRGDHRIAPAPDQHLRALAKSNSAKCSGSIATGWST